MRIIRCVTLLTFAFVAGAQVPGLPGSSTAAVAEKAAENDDPYGRSTPRGTVVGLLRAVQREDLSRATQYLDTRLAQSKAETLAEELKVVLDRRLFVPLNNISDAPEGNEGDADEVGVERIGSVEGPNGQVAIVLHRVARNGKQVWLFTPNTLNHVPEVYRDIDANWLEQNVPETLRSTKLVGVPLWRWLTFLVNIAGALLSASLASRLTTAILDRLLKRFAPAEYEKHIFELAGPMRVLFVALSFLVLAWLSSTMVSRNFWVTMSGVVSIIGFTWLAMRVSDGIFGLIEIRKISTLTSSDMAVRRLMQRMTKLLLVLIGFMALMRIFGKDPTTLIAGLGVGGIAIAFAAQKTLENLFGGIMIISDRPIRVGDYCKVGLVEGTVEDIGLRSTRIRTQQRTVVSIPNGMLATQNLENFAVRDKFLVKHLLGLRFETTPAQMRQILAAVTALLAGHPSVEPGTFRVRFLAFNASSMDVELFAYLFAPDYSSFLEVQQSILLRIAEIVQECGSGFAFPSQTMYLAKDSHTARPEDSPDDLPKESE